MRQPIQQGQKTLGNLRLTLAASLLVLAQTALAADEIGITPYQRQLNLKGNGIVTLRFEVENRSGMTRQLQENISLPEGWQLISNTAPFLLADGMRDVRLIHVSPPKGAGAGNYQIGYNVTSLDNGGIASHETVTVQLQAQAGLKLEMQQAPGSLLEGEGFIVDFLVENTGNQEVTYALNANDNEGFIHAVEPRRMTLPAGRSALVRIKGRVSGKISETSRYTVTLQARGGGNKAEQTAQIPLIARVPAGLGKYQKLPGKIKTTYTIEAGDGKDRDTSRAVQLEYFGRGSIDKDGEHSVEVKLRNGQTQANGQRNEQLEEYYLAYWNDGLKVKTGHQSFSTNHLTGNSLTGIGASATFNPKGKKGKRPLTIHAFYGQTRPGEKETERSVFAALNYDWDKVSFEGSVLEHQKNKGKKQLITAASGTWRGENLTARAEIASDGTAQAYSTDLTGQWDKLGFNASVTRADAAFNGSISDTLQAYANLNYQLDERNTFSARARQTRDNLAEDQRREIRSDQEGQIRYTHVLDSENPAEITVGYRHRREKDLRPAPTTNRKTEAVILEYQKQFDAVEVRLATEFGKRTDTLKTGGTGSRQEISVNWHPEQKLHLGGNYAINNGLDNVGKSHSAGINGRLDLTPRSHLGGYVQYTNKEEDNSHSRSYELQYQHDLRKLGEIGIRARQIDNLASDGERKRDHTLQLEYTLPLDIPFRRRDNIGSLQGSLRTPDNQPAADVVLQLDGQYAVTDQQGRFSYPDIVAKDYQLSIDASRPGTQGLMIDSSTGENTVQVEADKTAKLNLTLSQGAHLKGRLLRFVPDTATVLQSPENSGNNLKADKGVGMVLLELHPIGERGKRIVHRRSTLFDGSFSFIGIPPGQWELVVTDPSRLPDNFRLEQSRFAIELSPGNNQDVLIRALPAAQTIKKTGPQQGFDVSG